MNLNNDKKVLYHQTTIHYGHFGTSKIKIRQLKVEIFCVLHVETEVRLSVWKKTAKFHWSPCSIILPGDVAFAVNWEVLVTQLLQGLGSNFKNLIRELVRGSRKKSFFYPRPPGLVEAGTFFFSFRIKIAGNGF